MCLALRYFSTGGLYSLIGESQQVSRSTVCRAVQRVTNFLADTSPRYISWPEPDRYPQIAHDFYTKAAMPRVVGCIDGCHIPIRRPAGDDLAFMNRKRYHSLNGMVRKHHYTRTINFNNYLYTCVQHTCVQPKLLHPPIIIIWPHLVHYLQYK